MNEWRQFDSLKDELYEGTQLAEKKAEEELRRADINRADYEKMDWLISIPVN